MTASEDPRDPTNQKPRPRTTRYEIRDHGGELRAVHLRKDSPDGKQMAWRTPTGAVGLGGVPVASLPLYGSERVSSWDPGWIVVTEGESDCDALTAIDIPALGTVTGAASCPTSDAIRPVAAGRRFVLWPDADDAGRIHMRAVGAALWRAGAVAVRMLAYQPVAVPLPKGAGARDVIGDVDSIVGRVMVAWLIDQWSYRVEPPLAPPPPQKARRDMGDTGSVSSALITRYGIERAAPGRSVRCPAHDDRRASLSILRDDRRAVCHAAGCPWSGRGVIARDILEGVRA